MVGTWQKPLHLVDWPFDSFRIRKHVRFVVSRSIIPRGPSYPSYLNNSRVDQRAHTRETHGGELKKKAKSLTFHPARKVRAESLKVAGREHGPIRQPVLHETHRTKAVCRTRQNAAFIDLSQWCVPVIEPRQNWSPSSI